MSTAEVEVSPPGSTYEWLSSLPLASSAGNTVYGWYEGSKNCCRVSQYALGTVESSVKYAASTAAPIVKRLDRPIQAVDSFTVNQLIKLEEKVPAIKSQPEEVVTYLSESKDAISTKITDSHLAISSRITSGKDAVSSRISSGKEAVTTRLSSGKEAVYNQLSAGSEVIVNSRAGKLVSDGKQALTTRLSQGKETISTTLQSGRDAAYKKLQDGAGVLANTRAGSLVGSGVDRTILATESLVDYLLPEIEDEKEFISECDKTEKEMKVMGVPLTRQTKTSPDEPAVQAVDNEGQKLEETECEDESEIGRVQRLRSLSRKVKLRMYYRSMKRLQTAQEQCKSTLQQLKLSIDVLKMAQSAREGLGKQYESLTTTIKDLEDKVKLMLTCQSKPDISVSWLPEEGGEGDGEIQWLNPKPKGTLQASLDYAKQLSERVYGGFQSVAVATTYLPHQLKGGATQAYEYAQEMYTTLKSVKAPTDLPANALNRISEILDTQLGYIQQLGSYVTSVLQKRPSANPAEDTLSEDTTSDNEDSHDEQDDDDVSADPSTSQPPDSEETDSEVETSGEEGAKDK